MISINLKPNAVTYTVLIKGQCQEGLILEAMKTLNQMKNEEILPNIRTFNTILRGCWRNGKIAEAREIMDFMKDLGIKPDITSNEYFIRTLCEFGKVNEAWGLLESLRKEEVFQGGLYAAIATAAALKGKFKLARKSLDLCRKCLRMKVVNTKAFKEKPNNKNKKKSVEMFLEIKNEEIESECIRVEEYLNISTFYLFYERFTLFFIRKSKKSNLFSQEIQ